MERTSGSLTGLQSLEESLRREALQTLAPLLRGTGSGRAPRRQGSRVTHLLPPASPACCCPPQTCWAASELNAHKYLTKVLREKKKPNGPKIEGAFHFL